MDKTRLSLLLHFFTVSTAGSAVFSLMMIFFVSCSAPSTGSGQALSSSGSESDRALGRMEPSTSNLRDSNLVICAGDLMRIDVAVPARKNGCLEQVQPGGDVATPDGSSIKAAGQTLGAFRVNLLNLYKNIPGYEEVQVDAYIYSSPYKVVRFSTYQDTNPESLQQDKSSKQKSWEKDFWADFYEKKKGGQPTNTSASPIASSTNSTEKAQAPTLYPRSFNAPLTLWKAIELEGGVPENVDPKKIHVLRHNLDRVTFDCSGPHGLPGGTNRVVSGDCIFLTPPETPVSGIFE